MHETSGEVASFPLGSPGMWAWAGGQGQQPWLRGRPRACPGCCVFVVAGGRRRAGAHPHHHHRLGCSSDTLLLNKVT